MSRTKLIVVGGAILAVIGMVLTVLYMRWQMLDPPVVAWGAIIVPLAVAAAVWMARKFTGRKRLGSFVGTLWLVGIALAFMLFGFTGACNAWLDGSTATQQRAQILERYRTRGGRRYVELASWRVPGERERMWLPTDEVDGATEVILEIREGFLGFAWIDDVKGIK